MPLAKPIADHPARVAHQFHAGLETSPLTQESNLPFTLSIETDAGTYVHGFHLGAIEPTARALAADAYCNLIPKIGQYIRTVALIRDHKIEDVFDGQWYSDYLSNF